MQQVDLAVRPRTKNSTNANRRARRNGLLPAVVYGGEQPPQPVLLDGTEFEKVLPTIERTTIFNLQVEGGDGEEQKVMMREIQRDPVNLNKLVHIDFLRIRVDEEVTVEIPIHLNGTPIGRKTGGVLEAITRRLEIRCLPLEVPGSVELDVSGMDIGDVIHVSDIKLPEGVEILTDPEYAVAAVSAPTMEVEAKPEEEEEAEAGEAKAGEEKEKEEKEEKE